MIRFRSRKNSYNSDVNIPKSSKLIGSLENHVIINQSKTSPGNPNADSLDWNSDLALYTKAFSTHPTYITNDQNDQRFNFNITKNPKTLNCFSQTNESIMNNSNPFRANIQEFEKPKSKIIFFLNKCNNNIRSTGRCCNCKFTQCLKLYCNCFASGSFCVSCQCDDCLNTPMHDSARNDAIKRLKEKNKLAFKPKIHEENQVQKHNKGCRCRHSSCVKNYCECYQSGVNCCSDCRCFDCRNNQPIIKRKKKTYNKKERVLCEGTRKNVICDRFGVK